jgi:GNAT superfamily N-acetyltransferase
MPPFVRVFLPTDQAQVLRLVLTIQREEFGIPVTAEEQPDLQDIQKYYLSVGGHFWVAEADGMVVGTLGLLSIGHGDLALRKMFVATDFRGKSHGVAAALLAAALAWAQARQVQRILLGTTEQFQAAHRFYEKHGFSVIPADLLPPHFPRMRLDTRFYGRHLTASA